MLMNNEPQGRGPKDRPSHAWRTLRSRATSFRRASSLPPLFRVQEPSEKHWGDGIRLISQPVLVTYNDPESPPSSSTSQESLKQNSASIFEFFEKEILEDQPLEQFAHPRPAPSPPPKTSATDRGHRAISSKPPQLAPLPPLTPLLGSALSSLTLLPKTFTPAEKRKRSQSMSRIDMVQTFGPTLLARTSAHMQVSSLWSPTQRQSRGIEKQKRSLIGFIHRTKKTLKSAHAFTGTDPRLQEPSLRTRFPIDDDDEDDDGEECVLSLGVSSNAPEGTTKLEDAALRVIEGRRDGTPGVDGAHSGSQAIPTNNADIVVNSSRETQPIEDSTFLAPTIFSRTEHMKTRHCSVGVYQPATQGCYASGWPRSRPYTRYGGRSPSGKPMVRDPNSFCSSAPKAELHLPLEALAQLASERSNDHQPIPGLDRCSSDFHPLDSISERTSVSEDTSRERKTKKDQSHATIGGKDLAPDAPLSRKETAIPPWKESSKRDPSEPPFHRPAKRLSGSIELPRRSASIRSLIRDNEQVVEEICAFFDDYAFGSVSLRRSGPISPDYANREQFEWRRDSGAESCLFPVTIAATKSKAAEPRLRERANVNKDLPETPKEPHPEPAVLMRADSSLSMVDQVEVSRRSQLPLPPIPPAKDDRRPRRVPLASVTQQNESVSPRGALDIPRMPVVVKQPQDRSFLQRASVKDRRSSNVGNDEEPSLWSSTMAKLRKGKPEYKASHRRSGAQLRE